MKSIDTIKLQACELLTSDPEIRKALSAVGYHKELYDIVTAMRGPDVQDFQVRKNGQTVLTHIQMKRATTGVIRFMIAGNWPKIIAGAIITPEDKGHSETRRLLNDIQRDRYADTSKYELIGIDYESLFHFIRHSESAFEKLGLSWSEDNELQQIESW
jgi:hypothetical protein